MPSNSTPEWLKLKDCPKTAELRFRRFRGESDFAFMVAVTKGMKERSHVVSAEDLAIDFEHTEGFDPRKDVLIAEVGSRVIGWARVWRTKDPAGLTLYNHFVYLLPEWHGKGVHVAMLRHNELRLKEIADQHSEDTGRMLQSTAVDTDTDWISALESEGYKIFRYGVSMVRPNLENIPDLLFPEGVEVRPVKPQHYRAIIDAWNEACRDMRGQIPISDEDFKAFQKSQVFDPSLWQIAWYRDQVVGTTMNFINRQANEETGRKRGHVEAISVRRPWRGKGIAKALIARSLKLLKSRGMTEAALGVDAENPSGARQLYEKMGFRVVKRGGVYRKPMI
jgi:GNAT superfamily N-acetyltransferase